MKYFYIILCFLIFASCEDADNDRRGFINLTALDISNEPVSDTEVVVFTKGLNNDGTYGEPFTLFPFVNFGENFVLASGSTDQNGAIELNSLVNTEVATLLAINEEDQNTYVTQLILDESADYTVVIPQLLVKSPAIIDVSLVNSSNRSSSFNLSLSLSNAECAEIWNGERFITDPQCEPNGEEFVVNSSLTTQVFSLQVWVPSVVEFSYTSATGDQIESSLIIDNSGNYEILY